MKIYWKYGSDQNRFWLAKAETGRKMAYGLWPTGISSTAD